MTKIGIVSSPHNNVIENTLAELFKMADISVFSYQDTKFGTFKQLAHDGADVFIAPIGTYLLEKTKSDIDILVFSDKTHPPDGALLNLMNKNAIIIINADDIDVYKYLMGSVANLLTYGFNSKASVTASSIEENMEKKFIQICIQRSFRTITGVQIDAQEIPFTLTLNKNSTVLNEIAAITTALATGITPKTISLAY